MRVVVETVAAIVAGAVGLIAYVATSSFHYLYGLIPVAVILLLRFVRPRDSLFGSAGVWLAFVVWEATIQHELTCDAECNIRVDWFISLPIVLAASAFVGLELATRRVRSENDLIRRPSGV